MFKCERCGSGYSANHIGVEHCPRCKLRDSVQAPLSFKVFRLPDTQGASTSSPAAAPRQAAAPASQLADVP